jgi:hypothetical protein
VPRRWEQDTARVPGTLPSVFRARIQSAFALPGRGTFLGVDILSGKIEIGDQINVPLLDGRRREVTSAELSTHKADPLPYAV